jgi:outer membrane cobalamin receptor
MIFLLLFLVFSAAIAEPVSLPSSEVYGGVFENSEVLEIKSDEWAGKNLSLADILAGHAGIQTRQIGGMGSFQTVSVRGMQGNQIAIAIDGVLLQSVGEANLGGIDLNQYERIEIYKGYIPAKFAANGMGGVINLVSKDAAAKGGKFYASYGSYNNRHLSIQASSPLGDSVFWTSNMSYRASDNNYPYLNRNDTQHNTEDDFYTRQKNAEYSQISGNHSFRIAHNKRNSVLRIEHSSEAGGIPGRESQETKTANSVGDAVLASYEFEELPVNGLYFGLLSFAGIERVINKWYYPLDKIGFALNEHTQAGLLTKNAGWQGSFYLEKKIVKTEFHGYFNYQYLESQNNSAMLTNYELSNSVAQASFAGTFMPIDFFNIKLNAASRYSKQKQENGMVSAVNFLSENYKERSGNLNSSRLSANFGKNTLAWSAFFAAGHYFREPSVFELFCTGFGIVPNPGLKAEQGEQAEFGVGYKSKNTAAKATLFVNRIRGRIVYITSGPFSKPLNAEKGEIYGIENEIHSEIFKWLKVNANATFQKPGTLPNEPTEQYYASILFLLPYSFEFSLEGEAHSVIYRDKAQRKEIPANSFYHAGLGYKPTPKTKISFYARNLNGAEYQHIYDAYPTPGRIFNLSYSHNF